MEFERFNIEQDRKFVRIGGGLAMSSGRAGFITVIGESREKGYQGKRKFIQLDEFESFDDRELIKRMGWLNYKYQPVNWFGDVQDVQLDTLLRELNNEIYADHVTQNRSEIKVNYAEVLFGRDAENPYKTVMAQLNQLLGGVGRDPKRQWLFIIAGKLKTHLQTPTQEEAFTMNFGDRPAIDSLAFVVSGMVEAEARLDRPPQQAEAEEQETILG